MRIKTFVAAGVMIAGVMLAASQVARGQAVGNGPTGPGHGKPGKTPGTVSIAPVDPGRPWGWAVKGFFSVVSSVLATLLSMTIGFSAVMLAAVVVYAIGIASLISIPIDPRPCLGSDPEASV